MKEMSKTIEELLRQRNQIDEIIRREYSQKVTVLFTDIVGSTEYFAKKGDIAGRAMVQRHNDLLFPIIEDCNGKVIKTIGDAIMACFGNADDGVQAGISMQQALAEYNQNTDDEIHIRIGLHTGKAIREPTDICGDTVNTSSRIVTLTDSDQILISKATKDELSKEGFNLYFHGDYHLKGIGNIPIYKVLWYEDQKSKELKDKEKKELIISLHNQTPPEPNFVGREDMLETITDWYKSSDVQIGALIGWGGFGKSALARRWYDSLKANNIQPDGIFWWGFYRNPYLDRFLEELLRYLAQGRVDLNEVKATWQKAERIKEFITEREYLIILDGLEEMQKDETEEFGTMKDRDFQEILRYIADSDFKGLCLITTRFPLTDIEGYTSYKRLDVEELSKEDTKLLFEKVEVKGTEDEIEAVWREFGGHTLSLVLLANQLALYYGGDIKRVKEIPPFPSDKEVGGKAHRILLWYDKQLNENQKQFMKIFSLFRQAVGEREFDAVFLPRIEMKPFHFKQMVDDLCKRRLISKQSEFRLPTPDSRLPDSSYNTYTTHPLIKGYFESIFDNEEKKACHKAIYEYFGKIAKDLPETLEEMQPLFEQVYHGCSAGLYDDVYKDVYKEKIHRWDKYFIANRLGAWETNLSLIKSFFPNGDLSQKPLVSKKGDEARLLNEAGRALFIIGKPKEAEELFTKKIPGEVECKDWQNAFVGYLTLTDLQFRIGELEKGLESAKKALEMGKNAKSDSCVCASKPRIAWILHLLGKSKEVEEGFKQADELERKSSGNQLHGLRGIFYTDFLISIKRIDEALEFTQVNLEICQRKNLLPSISRCHRCLAAIERIKRNHNKAETHLKEAIEIARKIGVPELEIEALLEFSRLDLDRERYEDAICKATDALKLITRTGFKLYEPEAELILAKAHLVQGDKEKAKTHANSALSKATSMHYHLVKSESIQLLEKIQNI